MEVWMMGIAIGFILGNAFRKILVPITPDGKTEDSIEEEAYIAGYNDGLVQKRGPEEIWFAAPNNSKRGG